MLENVLRQLWVYNGHWTVSLIGDLSRHSVLAILERCIWVFTDLTSELIKPYVLENLLC